MTDSSPPSSSDTSRLIGFALIFSLVALLFSIAVFGWQIWFFHHVLDEQTRHYRARWCSTMVQNHLIDSSEFRHCLDE